MANKNVDLHEVHEWIEQARSIMDIDEENVVGPNEVTIDEPTEDVAEVQIAFRKLLRQIVKFDQTFHDHYDCR